MIVISKNMIRSYRRPSDEHLQGDGDTETQQAHNQHVEQLLSSTPPDTKYDPSALQELLKGPHTGKESEAERREDERKDGGGAVGAPQQSAAAPTVVEHRAAPAPKVKDEFEKIPVAGSYQAASSLSRELMLKPRAGGDRGGGGGGGGPSHSIKVFIEPGKPPMKVRVQGATTVADFIELVIRQYREERREPPLPRNSEAFELRMVDDDDGTPDTDIAPLDRASDIHKFNVEAVALCERSDGDPRKRLRGVSLELNMKQPNNSRFFIKIHMHNFESHVLPVTHDLTLEDLLPLIAKKRRSRVEDLLPKDYKFVYMGEQDALEMKMQLSLLNTDELMLVRRFPFEAELKSIPEDDVTDAELNYVFTNETASIYTQYKVVKTNVRGKKQERIMGIDGSKIYNKHPDDTRRESSDKVQRAFIALSDVLSIDQLPDKRSFRIKFNEKGGTQEREYEAETKLECAEIVAKVRFLISNKQ